MTHRERERESDRERDSILWPLPVQYIVCLLLKNKNTVHWLLLSVNHAPRPLLSAALVSQRGGRERERERERARERGTQSERQSKKQRERERERERERHRRQSKRERERGLLERGVCMCLFAVSAALY